MAMTPFFPISSRNSCGSLSVTECTATALTSMELRQATLRCCMSAPDCDMLSEIDPFIFMVSARSATATVHSARSFATA